MAVQAQYPSNVLLLQNRGGAEESKTPLGIDFSLHPQIGGGRAPFIDQSQMLFQNNGIGFGIGNGNTRKRGRETATSSSSTSLMAPIINNQMFSSSSTLFQTTTHSPHLTNVVSTGLRLSSGDQLHHHQLQQTQQTQFCSSSSSVPSVDFSTQIRQQSHEIQHFIQSQAEQLKRTLAENRQRHYRALLRAAEESVASKLREKDAEAHKAARRHAELEARAAQLGAEAQAWRAEARAQEEAAAVLQAQLQHAIMSGRCARRQQEEGGMLDGQECAGGVEGQAEDAESAYVDPDRVVETAGRPGCKACRRRAAAVVVLPCRHLCMCIECDAVAQSCPVCHSYRNNSIEVFLS